MARTKGADGRAKADLLSTLVLATALLIVMAIVLHPGSRGPGGSAPHPTPPVPTLAPTPSPTVQGGSASPIAAPSTTGGGSGVVGCHASGPSAACPKDFTISGSVGGLYPGKRARLTLTLQNPNNVDIQVTEVTVAVTDTSNPSCPTSNLQAHNYGGPPVIVPADGTNTVSVSVTMLRSAPDACQGVTFTLTYGGKAEKR